MSISLTGLAFDPKVIAELEAELLIDNYDLNAFVFDKKVNPKSYSASYATGIEHMYTISIYDKAFSVTFSDDDQFACFIRSLCKLNGIKESWFKKLAGKIIKCIGPIKH